MGVILLNVSHLDADLIGLWWCNFYLLSHQRLVGLPSNSSLTCDDLVVENSI